ncbi:7770_t:CDS:2 [Paraglomus occultum]|uniref:7770_t:CDS:1 n=1 Tax=Paraglomus occultum TaxID=144539 RepID=A0A9N8Z6N3_9GLOM|nr:7770_t:CDS:2 [Paraglomus occultum]
MTALDEEIVSEVIACARFGELDELKSYIDQYSADYLVEKDEYGNTALHMASANGHLEIVEYIIQTLGGSASEIINAQNDSGNTALHWSALNGHQTIVEVLITHGVNAKIKNTAGRTAISEAQQNGHERTVEYLLSVVDPTDGNENPEEEKDLAPESSN